MGLLLQNLIRLDNQFTILNTYLDVLVHAKVFWFTPRRREL